MPQAPLLRLTLIIDAPDEPGALAIAGEVLARTGLPQVRALKWTAYPKLGPHSRVFAALMLPAGLETGELLDAADAVALCAVSPEGVSSGYRNTHAVEAYLHHNRIFDNRIEAFTDPRVLWLDLELETHPEAQASFRRALGLDN